MRRVKAITAWLFPRSNGETQMNHRLIVATSLVLAVVAIAGATVINAHSSRPSIATQASISIGVMRMMENAKDLPEEQHDAF